MRPTNRKTPSGRWAAEYVAHFLEGEPTPGLEFEYRAAQGTDEESRTPAEVHRREYDGEAHPVGE